MPTKRHRPEEIVSKLRQVDVLSRFAQLAPRMLSSPARFRRGMPNTPSVGCRGVGNTSLLSQSANY
jgi:hypothetical protein